MKSEEERPQRSDEIHPFRAFFDFLRIALRIAFVAAFRIAFFTGRL